ncbi:MAG: benzoate-CoA ligase family protein [Hyphomicrobiales bacterium]|nr:benzoate-CoA ligase family protein [Hyphomicrobiales bacterium]
MISGERLDVPLPEHLNLGSFYLDVNLDLGRGDRAAIYFNDQVYTFHDLWRLTNKVGNVLRALGVEPENRVLLVLDDSPEWVATWLATMKIGGVGTHAYTYLEAHDYAHLLGLVRPKVVVVGAKALTRIRSAARGPNYPKAILLAGACDERLQPGEFSLDAMLETADDRLEIEPTHRDDIAFWNFSSGSTGKPKGVPHMHRDSVISFASFNHAWGYSPDDIVLRVPKLFFHYVRDNGMLFALRSGAAVVLSEERSTPQHIFELIRKFRPTVLLNVPTMMRAMIDTPERERADLRCLRRNFSSGELLSPQLHREWVHTFGVEVIDRLGSAESGIAYLCGRPGATVPGSLGVVTPMVDVKLIDSEGREVAKGQPGVLMMRSDTAAQCYVREHEKSKIVFPGGDWVNTGDVFRQDDRDHFWYVGRADDMIKVSGIWVSPLEIEVGLHEGPGVQECAALGLRNQDGLMAVTAFVVLRPGERASAEKVAELKRFCRSRLGPHKCPGKIHLIPELPKTGQGKIDRRLLRERYAGMAAQSAATV